MKIVVQGLWHLGLVTAAGLGKLGNNVICYSRNQKEINELKDNKLPIFEPGLTGLIKKLQLKKKIIFSKKEEDLKKSNILWYCLDTPVDQKDRANVNFILHEIKQTILKFKNFKYLIISSQLKLGSIKQLKKFFKKKRDIKIIYIPENLRLGKSLKIFLKPDRIIVGIEKKNEIKIIKKIFKGLGNKLLIVSPQAAELIKHSINGFLALSICYINELSKIANLNNIISKDLELGLKTENRIGPKSYLSVGNAYAGGTLARDVSFLTKISKQNNLKNYLIQSISKSNENQKKYIYNQFKKMKISKNKKILFLGLAYKKGTSTSRRSEAICFFDWLINNNYKNIRLHDPLIKGLEKKYQNYFSKNLSNDLKKTDCILVFYNQIFYKKYSKLINKLKKRILLFDPFSIFKPHKKLKLI